MTLKVVKDDLKKVLTSINQLQKKTVLVGTPENKTQRSDEPINNASLAYIHNFGSPKRNIPARPYLIPGIEKVKEKIAKEFKLAALNAFKNPDSINQSYERVGLIAQASVKNTLIAGEGFEALAESTIKAREKKGFKGTKPLIRTGSLLNSTTYVIRNK